jgi:hypothetical protein
MDPGATTPTSDPDDLQAEPCDETDVAQPEPEELHTHSLTRPAPQPRTGLAMANGRADLHQRSTRLPDIQKLMPQSKEAEMGLICSFLLAPEATGALCEAKGLYEGHFFIPAHKTIFRRLLDLHGEHEPIDTIVLSKVLHDAGELDAAGGFPYLTELYSYLPTAANAGNYIEILQEKYALREAIDFHTKSAARCYDDQDAVWELMEETARKALTLAELATGKAKTRLPGLRDIALMLGENLPPTPPELIEGLLHQGSKLIISGTSKGRKTYALADMGVSVATGADWWGLKTKKGRVCYVNFEIQEAFFCRRIEDICRTKGVALEPGRFMTWPLRGHTKGIEKMVEELMTVLMRENFALIIFDPIYKALGDRDENKAGDVASMLNELERIAVKTGAAIAFGAHYSKGNQAAKESIDRIGGSGVFARDPDSIIAMTAHETEDCFTVEATLRNFKPLPPFVLKWEWPLFKRDAGLDPSKLKKANAGRESTYSEEDVLGPLAHGAELAAVEWKSAVKEDCGMSDRTFYAMKKKLWADKKVRKSKLSGKWVLA